MTSLAQQQQMFMSVLLDGDTPMPERWTRRQTAGIAVYRSNYRSALIDALRSIFARTERFVGPEPFRRAAIHHVIVQPPTGWSIDFVGQGFAETCAGLFTKDARVADLAWLEWAMHRAFTAADAEPMDAGRFLVATDRFGAEAWDDLRLTFMPRLAIRKVCHDMKALWTALEQERIEASTPQAVDEHDVLVWREVEQPVFVSVSSAEGRMLRLMRRGGSFGEACASLLGEVREDRIAQEAGRILLGWIRTGVVHRLASGANPFDP